VVFTGNEQHEISLADAARLTRNFREHADRGAAKGGLIERAIIERILAQDTCVGIRLYHGLDAKYKRTLVLVGVTKHGSNLVNGSLGGVRSFRAPFGGERLVLNLDPSESLSDDSQLGQVLDPRPTHSITIAEGAELVRRFRQESEPATVRAFYYSQEIFTKILIQKGCVDIRYYYGQQDTGEPCLVLAGVTRGGDDLIPGILGEIGLPCPPICGGLDALSS
jgi:hypothetical protein